MYLQNIDHSVSMSSPAVWLGLNHPFSNLFGSPYINRSAVVRLPIFLASLLMLQRLSYKLLQSTVCYSSGILLKVKTSALLLNSPFIIVDKKFTHPYFFKLLPKRKQWSLLYINSFPNQLLLSTPWTNKTVSHLMSVNSLTEVIVTSVMYESSLQHKAVKNENAKVMNRWWTRKLQRNEKRI